MKNKFLRLSSVIELTGLSRSTIYLMIKNDEFPEQVSLGERSVAWIEKEILDWIEMKINESRR